MGLQINTLAENFIYRLLWELVFSSDSELSDTGVTSKELTRLSEHSHPVSDIAALYMAQELIIMLQATPWTLPYPPIARPSPIPPLLDPPLSPHC